MPNVEKIDNRSRTNDISTLTAWLWGERPVV